MTRSRLVHSIAAGATLVAAALASGASAQETVKLGLSVPLSGAAANWGLGSEFMCDTAAKEIAAAGGVKVGDTTYNFECVAYDNKYNASEGTKVAQTLLNRDGIKIIGGSLGTAPVQALQTLAERQGALIFTTAWGKSLKGPKHPTTFTQMNTPHEILPLLIPFVVEQHPDAKTVAMLSPNDATGKETEAVAQTVWKEHGVEVLTSDFYERGTTEFRPIASKIAALEPAIIDLGSTPPADAGAIFKELDVLGWDGVKVVEVGTGIEGIKATGGDTVEGTYMGAAVTFDGDSVPQHMKDVNAAARAEIGESINAIHIGFYDSVFALKAAMEKAQSTDPAALAEVMPDVTFPAFYGSEVGFGSADVYGTPQQMQLPVIVTQIVDGKLVEKARLTPKR